MLFIRYCLLLVFFFKVLPGDGSGSGVTGIIYEVYTGMTRSLFYIYCIYKYFYDMHNGNTRVSSGIHGVSNSIFCCM